MILYHISTLYQLLYVICHRLSNENDNEYHLYMTEYILPDKKLSLLCKRLKKTGWFKKIFIVPESKFKLSRGASLNENSATSEIESVIENVSLSVEKWLEEDLHSYEKLYVASDQWSLGIYLLHNKIHYSYLEDASGMLSQESRYLNITKKFSLTNFVICEYLRGAGRAEIVDEKLCDLANQMQGFVDKKTVDFSIFKAIKSFDDKTMLSLLSFYDAKKIELNSSNKTCLFLTQFLQTLAFSDLRVQELLSTLLVDYIVPEYSLVIKPHPKDKWLDYRRIFPNSMIIDGDINSELLPFLFDSVPDVALTISSTSVGGLKDFIKTTYNFGTNIESNWQSLHIYYALCSIIEYLKFDGKIIANDVDFNPIEHFLRVRKILTNCSDKLLFIDDGVCFDNEKYYDKYDFAVFLAMSKYNFGVDEKRLEKSVEILIKLIPDDVENSSEFNPVGLKFFVYCKDENELKALSRFSENYYLKYTKATLQIRANRVSKPNSTRLAEKYNKQTRSFIDEIKISSIRSDKAE